MLEWPTTPFAVPALVGGTPLYLTGEDALSLTALNALTGVTLALRGRFLPARVRDADPAPRVSVFEHTLVPATDRTASTVTRGLGEGWLLEASVVASAGSPATGQTFARLSIVRGLGASGIDVSTLAQGYVTAAQRLVWPGGIMLHAADGPGALRSIVGTSPGAGNEFSETVPTGARWQLISFTAQLTTSATAATRRPRWDFDDGVNVFSIIPTNIGVTASQAAVFTLLPGGANISDNTLLAFTTTIYALPVFPAAARLRSNTSSLQAGDTWGNIRYLVREWIEGAS